MEQRACRHVRGIQRTEVQHRREHHGLHGAERGDQQPLERLRATRVVASRRATGPRAATRDNRRDGGLSRIVTSEVVSVRQLIRARRAAALIEMPSTPGSAATVRSISHAQPVQRMPSIASTTSRAPSPRSRTTWRSVSGRRHASRPVSAASRCCRCRAQAVVVAKSQPIDPLGGCLAPGAAELPHDVRPRSRDQAAPASAVRCSASTRSARGHSCGVTGSEVRRLIGRVGCMSSWPARSNGYVENADVCDRQRARPPTRDAITIVAVMPASDTAASRPPSQARGCRYHRRAASYFSQRAAPISRCPLHRSTRPRHDSDPRRCARATLA